MSIYKRNKSNYRKIYIDNFGSIPVDVEGRTYEIHHIDGNHNNNDPTNLKAVSIQEHYEIHYSQGDYYAAFLIGERLKIPPEELSRLASINVKKQIENGTHNFLKREDGSSVGGDTQIKRSKDGSHNFLKREDGSSLGKTTTEKLLLNGTHNFLKREDGSSVGGDTQIKRSKDGSHHYYNNRETVPCIDKQGNFIRISSESYYSQTGPKEDWDFVQNLTKIAKRRMAKKLNKLTEIIYTTTGKVVCVDKQGNCKHIPKEEYYSQTGPKEDWEWVHQISNEGRKRKLKINPNIKAECATKGMVTCYNKTGVCKHIPKEQYYSQTGPKEDWEWVVISCKEGKLRRLK